jgi:hypothetical protein
MSERYGGFPQGCYRAFRCHGRPRGRPTVSPFSRAPFRTVIPSLPVCPPIPLRLARRQHRETPPNHSVLRTAVFARLSGLTILPAVADRGVRCYRRHARIKHHPSLVDAQPRKWRIRNHSSEPMVALPCGFPGDVPAWEHPDPHIWQT